MTIKLQPKWKYLQGGHDTGNHGKCSGNSGTKKQKGTDRPIVRGSRVKSFS
jgi:hypothetical protein